MENAGLGATEVLLREFGGASSRAAPSAGAARRRCRTERRRCLGGRASAPGARAASRAVCWSGTPPRCAEMRSSTCWRCGRWASSRSPAVPMTSTSSTAALGRRPLVVDGLFGTGLDRDIRGLRRAGHRSASMPRRSRCSRSICRAASTPTPDRCGAWRCAQRCTVTFAAHKPGLHQFPGAELAGEAALRRHRRAASCRSGVGRDRSGRRRARSSLRGIPTRTRGPMVACLILAGSRGQDRRRAACRPSAPARGRGPGHHRERRGDAARAGAQGRGDHDRSALATPRRFEDALSLAGTRDAAAARTGLRTHSDKRALAVQLARELPIPCVLDADALTALGTSAGQLARGPGAPRAHASSGRSRAPAWLLGARGRARPLRAARATRARRAGRSWCSKARAP